MSYYWFNRKEILQKAKEIFSKEKAIEYYLKNKEAIKKVKELIQKPVKRRIREIKEYQRKRYLQLIQYKKEALQNKWVLFLLSIRMSEKTIKIWQY